ncbi:hypothetical protein SeMB42_g02300 [Synchytrium endobioticum]|uniref:D-aminoacyl-tRNA deacylase n=1 Tax=Synchytrium endobioticum TaxID=286115 RepID=A0A507CWU0_9FUNG|nr:hypothetical protein SeLEV6574_g04925 [Synchytrium endobioticum]TPX50317.1 hypothetical protein SeMB42_g02300 [Synchytrium endobioticum]
MRAVVQRVSSASVSVAGQVVSQIRRGLCVLIGVSADDQEADMDSLAKKILSLRLFPSDDDQQWKKSVVDADGQVLCVSQFTLYGQLYKGSKPDFHLAMKSATSKAFYESFVSKLKTSYMADKIQDGVFGAMMLVDIKNDGPVTIILDTRAPKDASLPWEEGFV